MRGTSDQLDLLVILWLAAQGEVAQSPPERSHGVHDIIRLVLRDSQLNMAEHKCRIKLSGLCVVLGGLLELAHDEQHLAAMVVNVGIVGILPNSFLKAFECLIGLALLHMNAGDFDQTLGE